MNPGECAIIAFSFAMVVFPTFVIIPSAFGLLWRSPQFRNVGISTLPFTIAAFSLVVATVFAGIRLLDIDNTRALALLILLCIGTVAILVFLLMLTWVLHEVALLAEYERAKKAITSSPSGFEQQTQTPNS